MLLILDGNVEIRAHIRSDLSNQTCLRHLFRLRAITILIVFSSSKRPAFFHTCATWFKLRSNKSSMVEVCVCVNSKREMALKALMAKLCSRLWENVGAAAIFHQTVSREGPIFTAGGGYWHYTSSPLIYERFSDPFYKMR